MNTTLDGATLWSAQQQQACLWTCYTKWMIKKIKTNRILTKVTSVRLVTDRTTAEPSCGLRESWLKYEWPDSHRHPHINLFTFTDSGELQIVVQNEFPQQWGRRSSHTDFIMEYPLTLAAGVCCHTLFLRLGNPIMNVESSRSYIFFVSTSNQLYLVWSYSVEKTGGEQRSVWVILHLCKRGMLMWITVYSLPGYHTCCQRFFSPTRTQHRTFRHFILTCQQTG